MFSFQSAPLNFEMSSELCKKTVVSQQAKRVRQDFRKVHPKDMCINHKEKANFKHYLTITK